MTHRSLTHSAAIALLMSVAASGAGKNSDGLPAPAVEPPPIPVGYDAFRMWDKWPQLRIGQRTYMRSTYDRRGGNEAADASHFLYQLADDLNVTLDVAGPGVLAFVRTNHWHGSPWHYIVDGRDHIVQESSTPTPTKPVADSVFLPEKAFPAGLTYTWSTTKGADLSWVQIPFEKSFTLAYGRTHYGTGYYIFHRFVSDAPLTQPITSWTPEVEPPADVVELIRQADTQLLIHGRGSPQTGTISVAAGQTTEVVRLAGPSVIRELGFSVPRERAADLTAARLRIWWDNADAPAVDAPVPLFFGTGSLYNRENREYLVKAFPMHVRFDEQSVHLMTYFPMPFLQQARIELVASGTRELSDVTWRVRHDAFREPTNTFGYFHATYVDHGEPAPGRDLVFLDTTKIGDGRWCGHFVGTSFIFSDRAVLTTLEGDPRFYFDDALTPQCQGTGTEEWGGGGDYWGGRTMTLPFAGHPVGARSEKEAKAPEDLVNSAYRFLLADLMPFGRNARITFEHGGENQSTEHYQSVTYWYGRHGHFLVKTDTLDVGDEADERAHAYDSPTASPVQTLTSRYEWGVDHVQGREIFPATTDTGRKMTGTSTFTLRIDPDNFGVMLRRTLDYAYPNQCAVVSVADDADGASWHEVGVWYTAGSNTCVYSNPRGELGATEHHVQTSNRRWREDEFLLPRELTRGRERIRVRITFTPRQIPLVPGYPLTETAWTEYRYDAYCFVMPNGE